MNMQNMENFEKVSLYCAERDLLVDVIVPSEDARRAERDIAFASSLLNAAVFQQSDASGSGEAMEMEGPDPRTLDEPTVGGETDQADISLYRWGHESVLLFLETYRTEEKNFNSGKMSHKRAWCIVAEKMCAKGHMVTGPQCAAKLRSLKKTYKATKDHNNKSGNDRRSWPFFEIMDDIFGKKAWSNPVAVASSTLLSIVNRDDRSPDNGCVLTKESSKRTSKVTIASLLAKRIKQKELHEENKQKRHKERMDMDQKLLDAILKMNK